MINLRGYNESKSKHFKNFHSLNLLSRNEGSDLTRNPTTNSVDFFTTSINNNNNHSNLFETTHISRISLKGLEEVSKFHVNIVIIINYS